MGPPRNYRGASEQKFRPEHSSAQTRHPAILNLSWIIASLLDMRTTISIDDDVHEIASVYAHARKITLGAALNELVRLAESAPRPKPQMRRSSEGVPLFARRGRKITSVMVKEALEETSD